MIKTYAYLCGYCDFFFDLTYDTEEENSAGQKFGYGLNLQCCPYCGSDELHRDFKREKIGVTYNGNGFYSTDHRK